MRERARQGRSTGKLTALLGVLVWAALAPPHAAKGGMGPVEPSSNAHRQRRDFDGDGLVGRFDGCPRVAEDRDGFADADGCPELDNDSDGLPDSEDLCPDVAEDRDGFADSDGCPEPEDADGDGVSDGQDRCPDLAEDRDGFDDTDGCPDLDNDVDGIADDRDRCPDRRETINGVDDWDGCPDEGPGSVRITATHLQISGRIEFETGSDTLKPSSHALLDQVVLTLKANPQIAVLRIEGHTDDVGGSVYNLNLSQARAESVERYLVQRGVSGLRLDSIGHGESRPLTRGTSSRDRAANRRVEFRIAQVRAPEQAPALARGQRPQLQTVDGRVLVFFEGGATLSDEGRAVCDAFADWMHLDSSLGVRVLGFTDPSGVRKRDQAISQERAEAVQACLTEAGVEPSRIEVKALGSKWPRLPNTTEALRAENRRVRLVPLGPEGTLVDIPGELKAPLLAAAPPPRR